MADGDYVPKFKLVVLGDQNTGKTTFIKRYVTGEFQETYITNTGVQVEKILFHTTRGVMCIYVWDISGKKSSSLNLNQGYYFQAQCAFIFFDLNSPQTYNNVENWYRELTFACGKIPTVICGTKSDIANCEMRSRDITFPRDWNAQFFKLSSKTYKCFERPFQWALRTLVGDPNLKIVESEAAQPPVTMHPQDDWQNVPNLPDDDDL